MDEIFSPHGYNDFPEPNFSVKTLPKMPEIRPEFEDDALETNAVYKAVIPPEKAAPEIPISNEKIIPVENLFTAFLQSVDELKQAAQNAIQANPSKRQEIVDQLELLQRLFSETNKPLLPTADPTPPSSESGNIAFQTPVPSADETHPNTADQLEVELSKVELAKQIADSTKWLMLAGKVPTLVGESSSIDFQDFLYVRKPQSGNEPSSFDEDKYTRSFKQFGHIEASGPHQLEKNVVVRPPQGEVIIRHLPVTYENGQGGVIFTVSMVNGDNHPFDPRGNRLADYFSFDVPAQFATLFVEEALKDPSFVRIVIEQITKQSSILSNYTAPSEVVFVTQPGINSLQLNKPKAETLPKNHHMPSSRGSYIGNYLVSDGKTVTPFTNQTASSSTEISKDSPISLPSLKIDLTAGNALPLDRKTPDQQYEKYHTAPEEIAISIQNAKTLRELQAVLNKYSEGQNAVVDQIQKGLFSAQYTLSESISTPNVEGALEKLPNQFHLREKLKPIFLQIAEAIKTFQTPELDLETLLATFQKLDQTADVIRISISYLQVKEVLKVVQELQSLKSEPANLLPLLIGTEKGLPTALTLFNVKEKIFLSLFDKWNPFQRWRAISTVKSQNITNKSIFINRLKDLRPELAARLTTKS